MSRVDSLELIGVSHSYGGLPAVRNVSLMVGPGEIVCLLGPSGCGKSTTLRLAAGLEDLQAGEVRIGGRIVALSRDGRSESVPTEARQVGMVFQDHALFPHLRVRENIAFGLHDASPVERSRQVEQLAAKLGLGPHLDKYPHQLSGGEQQRVALARALAPRPQVMLLDEPFSSLDGRLRDQIRADTKALLAESGTPALMVTHDPEEAMLMADRIGLMREGWLEQVATPAEIYFQPASAFAARFLSETNEVQFAVTGGRIETPWGALPASGLAEGSKALAVFRPESLFESQAGPEFLVVEARQLGPARRLELAFSGGELPRIVARLPAGPMPAPGSLIRLALNPAACFVFPAP